MKKLLILGAGILQVAVIKKAKEMGIYTIVVDGNPEAIGLLNANKPIVANILDQKAVLQIAEQEIVDGVIHPCSEVAMHTMGYINDKMYLNGIGLETAIRTTNKEKMRGAFASGNAPSPFSKGAKTVKDALSIAHDILGDIIIKPSRSSGSRGVTHLPLNMKKDEDIISSFYRAIENSFDNSVVIEEYIDGPEFSVEIVIWNNNPIVIAVTDKLTNGSPFFVELGHSQPSQFSMEVLNRIKEAAILGCKSLKLNYCTAHVEIKLQNNKPYLIEIGARLGGDFISTDLVYLSTGIDMVAAAINLSLGIEPDLIPKHSPQGAAIRYFIPKSGKISKLIVDKKAKVNLNIIQFDIYIKVGELVSNVKSSLDRSGHVITIGSNAEEAILNAEKVLNKIKYEIEE
jgi:biotin carboxylase